MLNGQSYAVAGRIVALYRLSPPAAVKRAFVERVNEPAGPISAASNYERRRSGVTSPSLQPLFFFSPSSLTLSLLS